MRQPSYNHCCCCCLDADVGFETVNSANVTYVLMTLPFTNLTALQYNGSNCASPVVSEADYAAGYLAVKVYFGFSSDVIFPYGANNTVVAPANTTKFSIEAKGWRVLLRSA
jgi:hypothetical protein